MVSAFYCGVGYHYLYGYCWFYGPYNGGYTPLWYDWFMLGKWISFIMTHLWSFASPWNQHFLFSKLREKLEQLAPLAFAITLRESKYLLHKLHHRVPHLYTFDDSSLFWLRYTQCPGCGPLLCLLDARVVGFYILPWAPRVHHLGWGSTTICSACQAVVNLPQL